MNKQDIVMVNVTGTNGSTRNQKTVSAVFNGLGQRLDDNGKVDASSSEVLRNLPTGKTTPPAPPVAEMTEAAAAGDLDRLRDIQEAYAEQIDEYEQAENGGSESLRIARSVLDYCKEFHGFDEVDGEHFVLTIDDIDVVQRELKDGRSNYVVQGVAIFG